MADEEKPRFDPREFFYTAEQLDEAFKRAGASGECPICKNTEWHMQSGNVENGASRLVGMFLSNETGEFSLEGKTTRHIMLHCSKCGFTRLHSPSVLRGLLEAGKKQ